MHILSGSTAAQTRGFAPPARNVTAEVLDALCCAVALALFVTGGLFWMVVLS